jgi:gp16 family phage-associated protein
MRKKANQKYCRARARLIEQGSNITQWALENGFPVTTVYSIFNGYRSGQQSPEIRKKLEELTNA